MFLPTYISRPEDKPVCHDVLPPEDDEKIPSAGQAADQPPVLLHPDPMAGWLKTLNRYFILSGTFSVSLKPTRLVF